ncbi:MAG TPA: MXAN_5187 C-terminal domain-containing protein [Polyangiaceae bacterium]
MEPNELERLIGELEIAVDRLRSLYEQYFMGIERLEPTVPRKDCDRRVHVLRKEQIRNTALRFRFQMLLQRYNTYQTHWMRVCRDIENGTYKRHVVRAQKRFGIRSKQSDAPPSMPAPSERTFADELAELDKEFAPADTLDELDVAWDDEPATSALPLGDPRAPAIAKASIPSARTPRPPPSRPAPRTPRSGPPSSRPGPKTPRAPADAKAPATAPGAPAPPPSRPELAPVSAKGPPSRQQAPEVAPASAKAPPSRQQVPDAAPAKAPPPRQPVPKPPPSRSAPPPPKSRPAPPSSKPVPTPRREPELPDDRVRQLYSQYVETRRRQNESTATITYDSVARNLRESSAKLRQKLGRNVDFEVVVKDGRTILRPVVK